MAKVQLQLPIASIQGKLGRQPNSPVIYNLNGHPVLRLSAPQKDPKTIRQTIQRSILDRVTRDYKLLSPEQVSAWEKYIQDLQNLGASGIRFPKRVYDAFSQVNMHRLASSNSLLFFPPEPRVHVPPAEPPTVTLLEPRKLQIRFSHPYGPGESNWRIRLSPPLDSPARKAYAKEVRSPLAQPGSGYVAGIGHEESFEVETEWSYTEGQTLGLSLLALSDEYAPGGEIFYRRVEILPPP